MLHFKLKIRQKSFVSRAAPRAAYSAPPDPVPGLRRKGGRGRERMGRRGGEGDGREEKGTA